VSGKGRPSGRGRARAALPVERWLGPRPGRPAPADALSVVVVSPTAYSLAMSSLGFQTAVSAFCAEPGVRCERAFLQASDPRSYEAGSALRRFDVVAFSVSFERDFLAVAACLAAAGIPLRARDRGDRDPLVVMGGICAFLNPEPVAELMDAVLIGDARALVPPFVEAASAGRGAPRADRLTALSRAPGVYVPSLYEVVRDGPVVTGFRAARGAPLPVRAALARDALAESTVLSDGALFENMFLIETARGCARGCRFCAAGHVLTPRRSRGAAEVIDAVRRASADAARAGLVAAALGDHPGLREILRTMCELGCEANVSSLRTEAVDGDLAALLVRAGVRTATMAPEAGTEALREIAGKRMPDEVLLRAARDLGAAGMRRLKLYFMVGLPGEREEDVRAIPPLVRAVQGEFAAGRRAAPVSVGVSAFVPKPRTPFQWLAMAGERDVRAKLAFLRRSLAARPRVGFSCEGPRESQVEGVLARGGREVAAAVELAGAEGVPWKAALARAGVDPDLTVGRERADDEVFPWEIVEVGTPRAQLLASLAAARDLMRRRPPGAQ